jgi:hypothetical protein
VKVWQPPPTRAGHPPASRRSQTRPCWRAGALLPNESFSSLLAKLCGFNLVGIGQLSRVLQTFWIERPSAPELDLLASPIDSAKWDLAGFARWIGEPPSKLRELSVARWLPQGMESVGTSPLIWRRLRYCPMCVRVGYHAVFHQLSWFRTCLLHDLPLTQLPARPTDMPPRTDGQSADALLALYPRPAQYADASQLFPPNRQAPNLPRLYLLWLKRIARRDAMTRPLDGSADPSIVADVLHAASRLGVATPRPLIAHLCRSSVDPEMRQHTLTLRPPSRYVRTFGAVGADDSLWEMLRHLMGLRLQFCRVTGRRPVWRIGIEQQRGQVQDLHVKRASTARQASLFAPQWEGGCPCPECQSADWPLVRDWIQLGERRYLSAYDESILRRWSLTEQFGISRQASLRFRSLHDRDKSVRVMVLRPAWSRLIDGLLTAQATADFWRRRYETTELNLFPDLPAHDGYNLSPLVWARTDARRDENRIQLTVRWFARVPFGWPDWTVKDEDLPRRVPDGRST